MLSQHGFVLWSVSMGLCYGQVCASGGLCYGQVSSNGQSAWVCAMVRCVPVVSQKEFVLWSVSMGLCYGQVCASGQVCAKGSGVFQWSVSMGLWYGQVCAQLVSQHGFVLWSGVFQWSVSMGLCYGKVCASGQSAWVCAMVRCVPVVSQHGFVLWSGVCQWSVSMGLCYGQVCARWSVSMGKCYDWCMSMVNLCSYKFCYKEEVRTVVHCVQIIAVHQWCQTALKSSFVFQIYNILVSYNVYSTQTW